MQESNAIIHERQLLRKISRRIFLSGMVTTIIVGGTPGCLSVTPTPPPSINVDFVYSTEKDQWLSKAIQIFNGMKQKLYNKIIQVNNSLNSTEDGWEYGSLDAAKRILNGSLKPTAWSPANAMEIDYVEKQNGDIINNAGDFSPRLLVFSPLVFAIWKERSQVLQNHYKDKGGINWDTLQDAFSQPSWVELGGDSSWGPVKFGHTSPNKSNSGLLTAMFIAYNAMRIQRGLTQAMIDSPEFLNSMDIFERAVTALGRSSGTFLDTVVVVEGPRSYDIITSYESLVLAHEQQYHDQPFDIFYPQQDEFSEHPFAILKASWVSSEQREAARIFRDFLLGKDMQILARSYGFRPTDSTIRLKEPSNTSMPNPFASTNLNIKPPEDFQSSLPLLDHNVLDRLVLLWEKDQRYGNKSIATG